MATCNDSVMHSDHSPNPTSTAPPTAQLPPWLCHANPNPTVMPEYYPSVTLSLSTSTIAATPTNSWLKSDRPGSSPAHVHFGIVQCYKDLEESYRVLVEHKKEAAWRLKRVELILETDKTSRKRQKSEEIEAQIKAVKEEEKRALERIEMEYREQLAELRRESEAKELILSEQWALKHARLSKCLRQVQSGARLPDDNEHWI